MKILPNKSEKEILVAFLNQEYGISLDVNKTHFSRPQSTKNDQNSRARNDAPNDSFEISSSKNTIITVWNDDYVGDVDFNYRRVHLASQFEVVHGEVREFIYIDFRKIPDTQPDRNNYIISKTKEYYNLVNFDKVHITVESLLNGYTVEFKADPESLLYTGTVSIRVYQLETRLNLEFLDINRLTGFTYPTRSIISP